MMLARGRCLCRGCWLQGLLVLLLFLRGVSLGWWCCRRCGGGTVAFRIGPRLVCVGELWVLGCWVVWRWLGSTRWWW